MFPPLTSQLFYVPSCLPGSTSSCAVQGDVNVVFAQHNPEMIPRLLEAKADVHARDEVINNSLPFLPVPHAGCGDDDDPLLSEFPLNYLLTQPSISLPLDFCLTGVLRVQAGRTMLHYALCNGDSNGNTRSSPNLVKILLQHQADVSAEDQASVELEVSANIYRDDDACDPSRSPFLTDRTALLRSGWLWRVDHRLLCSA